MAFENTLKAPPALVLRGFFVCVLRIKTKFPGRWRFVSKVNRSGGDGTIWCQNVRMNIASALKQEISRVARKEVRAEVQSLKKASSQYRSDIAALKRRVMTLERLVGRLGRGKATASPVDTGEAPTALRFSAKGLAAQRKRLGLSAADAGRILGVSGASVYNWEDG